MTTKPEHPHQKVHAFLRQHHLGILSTVSTEGRPWGSAIYFIADDDFTFYFVTRAKTFKFQNLEANPHVALTVADEQNQTTVQLSGTVAPLPYEDYADVIFRKMAKLRPAGDHDWMPPVDKLRAGNYMPLVLTPTKLQYANYKQDKDDPHADYIEHILPAK
jgi:nitroimidazol reductase NimA-like FMN-containing flavoprotein (pyridoxamine 5'-phosphate oxidase superfamily)